MLHSLQQAQTRAEERFDALSNRSRDRASRQTQGGKGESVMTPAQIGAKVKYLELRRQIQTEIVPRRQLDALHKADGFISAVGIFDAALAATLLEAAQAEDNTFHEQGLGTTKGINCSEAEPASGFTLSPTVWKAPAIGPS